MCAKSFERMEKCSVYLSERMASLCKPYTGCPKGAVGNRGCSQSNKEIKEKFYDMLVGSDGNILRGIDEDFICIPQSQYEEMLCMLKRENGEGGE